MDYVDLLITSLPDQPGVSELISGLKGNDPAEVAAKLADRFGFKAVLVTLRSTPSVWLTRWTSLAYVGGRVIRDRTYDIEAVDRIGGGDACVAGFLTGYLEGDAALGVRLGNAFSALKQTAPTDWPWPTRVEAENLISQGETRLSR